MLLAIGWFCRLWRPDARVESVHSTGRRLARGRLGDPSNREQGKVVDAAYRGPEPARIIQAMVLGMPSLAGFQAQVDRSKP